MLVPIFSSNYARGRVHPGRVAGPSQGTTDAHEPNNRSHTTEKKCTFKVYMQRNNNHNLIINIERKCSVLKECKAFSNVTPFVVNEADTCLVSSAIIFIAITRKKEDETNGFRTNSCMKTVEISSLIQWFG